jgi:hypothetical protein
MRGLLIAIAGLLSVANAAVLDRRAVCTTDACLRAVEATNAATNAASKSSDCVAFFGPLTATVTVTPAIATATTTVASATSTKTVTATSTVLTTTTGTVLTTKTSTSLTTTTTTTKTTKTTTTRSTETDITTIFNSKTVTFTSLSYSVVKTQTVTYINFYNSVVPSTAPVAKRAITTLPAYASTCSNINNYSSACSCFIGPASGTTTTVTAPPTVSDHFKLLWLTK